MPHCERHDGVANVQTLLSAVPGDRTGCCQILVDEVVHGGGLDVLAGTASAGRDRHKQFGGRQKL